MTLLVNEIHVFQGNLQNSLILQAADQRITQNGIFHSNQIKLFKINYLNAGVGYFGLAQINKNEWLSTWLPNFIRHMSGLKTIQDFTQGLCEELNRKVNKALLKNNPSGFHICGYNNNNFPEFWFIRNFQRMEGFNYRDFATQYSLSEEFLARDIQNINIDVNFSSSDQYLTFTPPASGAVDIKIPGHVIQYYINGDVRPFHAIWKKLDDFLTEMSAHFKRPDQITDSVKIVKWKMEVISSFYKNFAPAQIIGTPIDVHTFYPKKTSYL